MGAPSVMLETLPNLPRPGTPRGAAPARFLRAADAEEGAMARKMTANHVSGWLVGIIVAASARRRRGRRRAGDLLLPHDLDARGSR
jgi:hypothetical protein